MTNRQQQIEELQKQIDELKKEPDYSGATIEDVMKRLDEIEELIPCPVYPVFPIYPRAWPAHMVEPVYWTITVTHNAGDVMP